MPQMMRRGPAGNNSSSRTNHSIIRLFSRAISVRLSTTNQNDDEDAICEVDGGGGGEVTLADA